MSFEFRKLRGSCIDDIHGEPVMMQNLKEYYIEYRNIPVC
jgi:hypothetical protein